MSIHGDTSLTAIINNTRYAQEVNFDELSYPDGCQVNARAMTELILSLILSKNSKVCPAMNTTEIIANLNPQTLGKHHHVFRRNGSQAYSQPCT
jgi:hypothetical protein